MFHVHSLIAKSSEIYTVIKNGGQSDQIQEETVLHDKTGQAWSLDPSLKINV
jgi:hypothetical protein